MFQISHMKSITVQELKAWQDAGKEFQLIDVREPFEFDAAEMGGTLIPMNSVPANTDQFRTDCDVVVHCRSGKRSANVIAYLEQNNGFTNLYNLEGGIMAWAEEIDPSLTVQ